jgi:hypothetical protein
MLQFAATIFTGAFLLFQVQPLIGKFILPWFGGAPAVWTTSMLFFQVVLLAGYIYAHLLTRLCRPRGQTILHGILLLVALALLPITPGPSWKPTDAGDPTWRILQLLLFCLGLPYFMLSSTGPLMQEWFRRLNPGVSPYRLYALSNLGSLLALLSYPFIVEPALTRKSQAAMWSWSFGLFIVLSGICALRLWKANPVATEAAAATDVPDSDAKNWSSGSRILWIVLSACAVVLLLAITNKICQDVAVIPFLWVLPLAIYLLSLVLCFDSSGWYSRPVFGGAFVVAVILLCDLMYGGPHYPLVLQIAIYAGTLFICCMICHGELVRLKPPPRHLTAYYLTISTGGATGGLFVAILAPRIFNSYAELQWGLWTCAVLLMICYVRDGTRVTFGDRKWPIWPGVLTGVVFLGCTFLMESFRGKKNNLSASRNFYGILRVYEARVEEPSEHCYVMKSGGIVHGMQFVHPARALEPTLYYHEDTGVALALRHLPRTGDKRIGMIGLGTGTLAVYGQTNDYIRYYEINPEVKRLAETRFSFVANSKAHLEVALGDARLSLENEQSQNFDLLVLDAFTSDSIPVHLLTREAFEVYLRHVKTNAVLGINISNRHLDLQPIVEKLAQHFQLKTARILFRDRSAPFWITSSDWILLSRDEGFLNHQVFRERKSPPTDHLASVPLWTDEYTSLFKILKRE